MQNLHTKIHKSHKFLIHFQMESDMKLSAHIRSHKPRLQKKWKSGNNSFGISQY